jgi:hypothetical protein
MTPEPQEIGCMVELEHLKETIESLSARIIAIRDSL